MVLFDPIRPYSRRAGSTSRRRKDIKPQTRPDSLGEPQNSSGRTRQAMIGSADCCLRLHQGANGHCMISCPRRIGRCYPDIHVAGSLNSTYVAGSRDGLRPSRDGWEVDGRLASPYPVKLKDVSNLTHFAKPCSRGVRFAEPCRDDAPKGSAGLSIDERSQPCLDVQPHHTAGSLASLSCCPASPVLGRAKIQLNAAWSTSG